MKNFFDLSEYPEYNWKICSYLKVVSFLLGLQSGYTTFMCILDLWNSRQDSRHYALKYGLLDKAPKSEDIMSNTSLWLALQMSF